MLHLRAMTIRAAPQAQGAFPFTVPVVAGLVGQRLAFTAPVTFFIGENGSGKSTLLEALACAIGSIAVGSANVEHDASLQQIRPLADALKLEWTAKTKRGFYMRSEDFFGYARRLQQMRAELQREKQAIEDDPTLSTYAKGLGTLPYRRELAGLARYGESLDSYSHGESFFALFRSRFVPNGLYLLDEPEAPLSPVRQLALIAMLQEMAGQQNAQFIIATHSPILMALPGATIYSFADGEVKSLAYEQTEHYLITRDFLNNPASFLKHL